MDENDQAAGMLSHNELSALAAILHYYERYLWNRMSPSAKRSRLSLEVSLLIVKLSLLPEGCIAMLQAEDIDSINDALTVFTFQAETKLPPVTEAFYCPRAKTRSRGKRKVGPMIVRSVKKC